jgi:hypothetical protein
MTQRIALPPAGDTATGSATLAGYGMRDWTDLPAMLSDATAAWADYNGFHVGPPPQEAPPYSHLWAWTPDWLLRARVEGQRAVVGILVLHGDPPTGGPQPLQTCPVNYRRLTARTWIATEPRVGPIRDEVANRLVHQYLLAGERPTTFIAIR